MWNYNYGPRPRSDDTLQHARGHKYIKRARANGRWRYWYKDDSQSKTKTGSTSDKTEPAKSQASSEYQEELEYNSKKNQYIIQPDEITVLVGGNAPVKELSKFERSLNYAKNWLADVLGVDEKAKAHNAKADVLDAIQDANKGRVMATADSKNPEADYVISKKKAAASAQKAYAATPLGKLEAATDKVEKFFAKLRKKKNN